MRNKLPYQRTATRIFNSLISQLNNPTTKATTHHTRTRILIETCSRMVMSSKSFTSDEPFIDDLYQLISVFLRKVILHTKVKWIFHRPLFRFFFPTLDEKDRFGLTEFLESVFFSFLVSLFEKLDYNITEQTFENVMFTPSVELSINSETGIRFQCKFRHLRLKGLVININHVTPTTTLILSCTDLLTIHIDRGLITESLLGGEFGIFNVLQFNLHMDKVSRKPLVSRKSFFKIPFDITRTSVILIPMTKTFTFDEEAMCPECGKSLDDCPARDFVVWRPDNTPIDRVEYHDCGWCDAMLVITLTGDGSGVNIKHKH